MHEIIGCKRASGVVLWFKPTGSSCTATLKEQSQILTVMGRRFDPLAPRGATKHEQHEQQELQGLHLDEHTVFRQSLKIPNFRVSAPLSLAPSHRLVASFIYFLFFELADGYSILCV